MPPQVLTNCDYRCFEALFDPFMSAIANASGGKGGFTQHVVVIAIGDKAYEFCREKQGEAFKHACVLDPYCFMDRQVYPGPVLGFHTVGNVSCNVGVPHCWGSTLLIRY